MRFTAVLLVLCALPLLSDDGAAGDWPSWRGPNRDDISTETGLLKQWPEGGPKKLWTSKDAGLGYSGVSVVGDMLYTMGADGTTPESKEFVIALNVKTGEKSGRPTLARSWKTDGAGGLAARRQWPMDCSSQLAARVTWSVCQSRTVLKNGEPVLPNWVGPSQAGDIANRHLSMVTKCW